MGNDPRPFPVVPQQHSDDDNAPDSDTELLQQLVTEVSALRKAYLNRSVPFGSMIWAVTLGILLVAPVVLVTLILIAALFSGLGY